MAFFGATPTTSRSRATTSDICLMRAYENGRPVKSESFLRWSPTGVADGDLGLRVGPSRVDVAPRDHGAPRVPARPGVALQPGGVQAAARRPARVLGPRRRADAPGLGQVFGYENSQKPIGGYHRRTPRRQAMAAKAEDEKALRAKVRRPTRAGAVDGRPVGGSGAHQEKLAPRAMDVRLVGFGGRNCSGWPADRAVRRRGEEAERATIRGVRGRQPRLAPEPAGIAGPYLRGSRGGHSGPTSSNSPSTSSARPPVREGGARREGRAERAKAAVDGTTLANVAARQPSSTAVNRRWPPPPTPMIELARRIDPMVREMRRFVEDDVEAPTTRRDGEGAQARWRVYGARCRPTPPHAPALLRTVKGFPAKGTWLRPSRRSMAVRPLDLPRREGAVGAGPALEGRRCRRSTAPCR